MWLGAEFPGTPSRTTDSNLDCVFVQNNPCFPFSKNWGSPLAPCPIPLNTGCVLLLRDITNLASMEGVGSVIAMFAGFLFLHHCLLRASIQDTRWLGRIHALHQPPLAFIKVPNIALPPYQNHHHRKRNASCNQNCTLHPKQQQLFSGQRVILVSGVHLEL